MTLEEFKELEKNGWFENRSQSESAPENKPAATDEVESKDMEDDFTSMVKKGNRKNGGKE